jgi:23S rRNA (adenine-N6)-dimethyltransferase
VAVRPRPIRGAPGQHALRSSRLAAALVGAAGISAGDLVVDVGAGTGVLTRALLRAGARVIALELDPALAAALGRDHRHARLEVLNVDASSWDWPPEPFSVVANLPFTGSTVILGRLLRDPGIGLRRADVIVQWELAVKHAAVWPATLKGTYWRTWNDVVITHRLSRTAFSPVPEVDAAVLAITPRRQRLIPTEEHDAFWRFLSTAFRSRRSVSDALLPYLARGVVRRVADTHGFSPTARARDLDPWQWARLFALRRSPRGR